jgi:hypothetical protein
MIDGREEMSSWLDSITVERSGAIGKRRILKIDTLPCLGSRIFLSIAKN